MALVRSCCGLWDLREGARNVAVISMVYDLIMAAGLILVLLLYIPWLPWKDPPEPISLYQIMLIISISVRGIHLIPSFFLLYSTWEESTRGVGTWLFFEFVDILLHGSWIAMPFVHMWPLDIMTIAVTFIIVAIIILIYFISVVSSYLAWLKERDQDIRARRRLKDFY
jgi:hypothetical protein